MGNGKVDALKKIAMVALFVAGLVFLLSGGDEDNQRRAEAGHAKTVAKKESVQPQPLYGVAPDGTFDIKEEVYGDPDIFDSPRIQFLHTNPETYKHDTIWSVKTDGTDLRRVLSKEQIFTDMNASIMDTPRRSPDNRFICVTIDDRPNGFHKVVFDLKTGQRDVIVRHGKSKGFSWMNDSKTVVFFGGGGFSKTSGRLYEYYKYDIIDKTITPYDRSKNIYFGVLGFLIHHENNMIFARGYERSIPLKEGGLRGAENLVKTYGVCIFNPDWSKHRMLVTDGGDCFDVSPDGQRIIRGNYTDYFSVYSTKNGKIISQFASGRYVPIFSEDSVHIYVPSYEGFEKRRISDGKVVFDVKLPIEPEKITLINI
ncbi:TolB-like translocation protein [Desulfoluna spongiiphila]|uniref:hypothetical protein n=1 Tax=Desulfoluna spongiiphila TaxID=419481 RepID=UPI001258A709|nr:hypothetical protein [Desulfoluna spongiiphila]VVS95713.1 hypothetical protein DBB_52900 [Desulfoluna spongiiphila]